MNSVIINNPEALRLLWAVPVLALCFVYAARKRGEALRAFASAAMAAHLVDATLAGRRGWKAVALCLAFGALTAALAAPAWNPSPAELHREGRDVVFLLDVSRSMLARDLVGSRLDRAKAAIADCLDHLQGDRVALVAFAGEAVIRCPLTMDYSFFRMCLEDIDPSAAPMGGTQIGAALETIIESVLQEDREERQDIVLITDGEDHDSDPVAAAHALEKAGARLIILGIGDDQRGQRVPVRDEATGLETYLVHENQEVWSRLDATTLRDMVNATRNGVYLHVATGTIDLPEVYRQLILSEQGRAFEDQTLLRYEEKFQVFLAVALVLLLLAAATGGIRASKPHGERIWQGPGAATLLLLACSFAAQPAAADSAPSLVSAGNRAYAAEDYDAATDYYNEALGEDPDAPVTYYDLGNALYRRGDLEAAMEAYQTALYLSEDGALAGRTLHNLGNCIYHLAKMQRGMDLQSAAGLCRMSAQYFRAALDAEPARRDSAINLEIARRAAAEMEAEQADAEDLRKQLQEALEEIAGTLEELIARQEAAERRTSEMSFADTAPGNRSTAEAREEQRVLRTDTQTLLTRMEEVNTLFPELPGLPKNAPPEMVSPLGGPIEHVETAVAAQGVALAKLAETALVHARNAQREAVAALRRALEAMPAEPPNDESEGDPNEQEWDEEEEYDETDEDGDQQADEAEPEEPPEDEEFTAPKESPEDILEEERKNNLQRKQKRPEQYLTVEKDW